VKTLPADPKIERTMSPRHRLKNPFTMSKNGGKSAKSDALRQRKLMSSSLELFVVSNLAGKAEINGGA
jgi:hypothetical protein